jgi:hypothetical protein
MLECYNAPDAVYRVAKARGMDLVTITDHDEVEGAFTLADRPDVIVGCEVRVRFAGNLCLDQGSRLCQDPLAPRAHARFFGGILGLPLVSIALAGAYLHFVTEERFNENLLFDLVARPARSVARVPEMAA